ncbi:enoyl-CoA hydratase-related protein [Bacillus spongiae]|uniref:Enoyl-CoA hydratase-related protein n=1 Tax=Bacillus spongiae TaxID=2683610 RepID=A0ABU8HAV6_9BACI
MDYTYAKVKTIDFITTITIDNPPANTLSTECIHELRSIFEELSHDDGTNAIILTGSGRFFVAGADIKEFVQAFENKEMALQMAKAGQALCNEIEAMMKPVIAAINGPALGGGLELAMGCHYRIASNDALLGLPELKLGLLPTFGGTQRLSRLTNTATAMDMILSSKQISADEAVQLGLIQLVACKEELLKTAQMVAQAFVQGKSMTSVSRAVECIMLSNHETLEVGLEMERARFAELFLTNDAKEGVNAFIEKRKPTFNHS